MIATIWRYHSVLLILCMGLYNGYAHANSPTKNYNFLENTYQYSLDNGLDVILIPDKLTPIVKQHIIYHVGAIDEPAGKSGLAHFLEHLMFKGTTRYPNGQFSDFVKNIGGRENAYTTPDSTQYFQLVAKQYLADIVRFEANRMRHATFNETEFETEKNVVLEERLERVGANPSALLNELANTTLYRHHPYRVPTIGWQHEIDNISLDDAYNFYHTYYHPNNATLIISGDFSVHQAKSLIKQYYGAIKPTTLQRQPMIIEPKAYGTRTVSLAHHHVAQGVVTIERLLPRLHDFTVEKYAALKLIIALYEGQSGILYNEFVATNDSIIAANIWYLGMTRGPANIGFRATSDGTINALEAGVLMQKFMQNWRDHIPDDAYIDTVKKRLRDELLLQQDGVGKVGNILSYIVGSNHQPAIMNDIIKAYNNVTRSDIISVMDELNFFHDGWVFEYLDKAS